jgi:uncharacterized protein DUF2442
MKELRLQRVSFGQDDLIAHFTNGTGLGISLSHFPRLRAASPVQRANWTLIGRGRGIHWKSLDEDLSVENLLAAYSRGKSRDYAPTRS